MDLLTKAIDRERLLALPIHIHHKSSSVLDVAVRCTTTWYTALEAIHHAVKPLFSGLFLEVASLFCQELPNELAKLILGPV